MEFKRDLKILETKRRAELATNHNLEFESKKEALKKLRNDVSFFKEALISFADSNLKLNGNQTIETIKTVESDVLEIFKQVIEIQTDLGRLKDRIIKRYTNGDNWD